MKRVIILLMAAVMVLGTVSLASAVEFKTNGHMMMLFGLQDNLAQAKFNKDTDEDNFYAGLRFRPKLTIKGEGVSAVFEAQSHQSYFGTQWKTNSPSIDFRVRNAYIDFKLPGTPVSVKAGFQQLSLPSVWGHPVFHTRVGGVVATIPVNDKIAVAAFWARPSDGLSTSIEYDDAAGDPQVKTYSDKAHNSLDMFGLLVPLNFGQIKATPYFVYAKVGALDGKWDTTVATNPVYDGNGTNDTLIVGGVNVNANVNGLIIKVDGIVTNYSSDVDANDIGLGFMAAAEVGYKMSFGTPALMAWYATGADDEGEGALWTNAGKSDFTDGFSPTTMGFDGSSAWGIDNQWGITGASTMGIGLKVSDMSFVDGLKHTFRVVYVMGTADDDVKGGTTRYGAKDKWTKEDSMIELNLDSTWSMYENLAAIVEIGAMIPDINTAKAAADQDDLGWRAQVNFNFKF